MPSSFVVHRKTDHRGTQWEVVECCESAPHWHEIIIVGDGLRIVCDERYSQADVIALAKEFAWSCMPGLDTQEVTG